MSHYLIGTIVKHVFALVMCIYAHNTVEISLFDIIVDIK